MEQTLGARIAALRKAKKMTQEELGELLGVSGQAVSKWENDISAPDISILLALAQALDTTTDALLGVTQKPVRLDSSHAADDMVLRMVVDSAEGDKVRINLPLKLVRVLSSSGAIVSMAGEHRDAVKGIDFQQLIALAEQGVIGELLTIDTGDGTHVRIVVEA